MVSHPSARSLVPLVAGALLSVALVGCEDPLSSRRASVPEEPSEATLVSLQDGSLRDESAFDVTGPDPVRTDQTSEWDFVVRRGEGGELQFTPRNVVLGTSSAAGLQRSDFAFEELTEAPQEGYTSDEPVPVETGAVYAVRSRRDPTVALSCFRFMKMEVLTVDAAAGTVTFRYLGNPNCGRRTLEAGASGEEQDA